MGLFDSMKDQFIDVIEWVDNSGEILVNKYHRPGGNDEIKKWAKLIVRESQCAVFLKGGKLADILPSGTHTLSAENLPILSTLGALPYGFYSPKIADLYFISTKQFVDKKWATKNPVLKRDGEFGMVRLRVFGKYAFRIVDAEKFMREIFGAKRLVFTFDIVQYLSSLITEAFAVIIGESNLAALDMLANYRQFAEQIQTRVNQTAEKFGIMFSDVFVENISLPDAVEQLIDEQSGIGMAKQDMGAFMQYQSARSMRDAAKQEGGLAGLGAGLALGKTMADTVSNTANTPSGNNGGYEQLKQLKTLLDDGILTLEEFDLKKKQLLNLP